MNQQNHDKLKQLRLSGMADAYETLLSNPSYKDLTFDELLGIMIDQEDSVRRRQKIRQRVTYEINGWRLYLRWSEYHL